MKNSTIDDIFKQLRELESELEVELDHLLKEKQEQFRYTLNKGRVQFEKGVKALQKHHQTGLWHYIFATPIRHILSAPIIYSMVFPLFFLDVMATFYQQTCFRIYGIPLIKRSSYMIIDRQHLAYLNIIEKFNCVYCSYANGLIGYMREISARTEQYWCPIKHAQRSPEPHKFVHDFADYGDADNYKRRLMEIRAEIRELKQNK